VLHAFLSVGRDFSTWIKDRIKQYSFVENQDFSTAESLSSPESGSAKARPQRIVVYTLSLDMAKKLSMVERTPRGKEARQYFLQCEKRALAAVSPVLPAPAPVKSPIAEISVDLCRSGIPSAIGLRPANKRHLGLVREFVDNLASNMSTHRGSPL
jgi:phage anti-repressor protein